MRTRKSLDVHRVRTPMDAKFYAAGIPSTHWNPEPGSYRFRTFKVGEDLPMVPPDTQTQYAAKLLSDPGVFSRPELVFVCVKEHETLAASFVYDVLKAALAAGHRIQIDSASADYDLDPDWPVVALMNVADSGTVDRRQRIRDWIHDYEASFRILCIAGTPETAVGYFDVRPTLAFSLSAGVVVAR